MAAPPLQKVGVAIFGDRQPAGGLSRSVSTYPSYLPTVLLHHKTTAKISISLQAVPQRRIGLLNVGDGTCDGHGVIPIKPCAYHSTMPFSHAARYSTTCRRLLPPPAALTVLFVWDGSLFRPLPRESLLFPSFWAFTRTYSIRFATFYAISNPYPTKRAHAALLFYKILSSTPHSSACHTFQDTVVSL